ncbi:hypothetical protein H6B07_09670 [Mediterraneibacter glycyrrhizinilyticus]|nr:hypothetical protein [Mediterraneibacter glycyrrhizinilyticus]MBM6802923.1 hypothetical protein [Mediterraneibacter glycyrrhizinilyticus]
MSNKIEEAETVRERTISVKLSDADCKRVLAAAGQYGMTVGELLEKFIADLVDGTFTNGSDERMYARQWLNRCLPCITFPTVLGNLVTWQQDPEEYLKLFDELAEAREYKKYIENHKEEYGRYWEEDIREQADRIEELKGRIEEFCGPEMNEDRELEMIRRWIKERKSFFDTEEEN